MTLLGRLEGTPEIEAQIREHVSEQSGKLEVARLLGHSAVMTEPEQKFAAARAAEE